MATIEIKHRFTGAVLFACEVADDVKSGLRMRAALEKAIENLDKVREIILDNDSRLQMSHWHGDSEWVNRTCAEEALFGTTHCLAGWLQVCSTEPALKKVDAQLAGVLSAPIASKMFFRGNAETLEWLRNREYAK